MKILKSRYALVFSFIIFYVVVSTIVRALLLLFSPAVASSNFAAVIISFLTGFVFDLAVALSFTAVYTLYLLLIPKKWIGSKADKTATYIIIFLMLFIAFFAFAAEFPFWDEFKTRFNFIAVDYLIYTYEVVENINQSYPIPLILLGLFAAIFLMFYLFKRKNIFNAVFSDRMPVSKRFTYSLALFIPLIAGLFFLNNKWAEKSQNTYVNELGKNGVFSFFSAMKSNELNYLQFYPSLPEKQAYKILKSELHQSGDTFTNGSFDNITREIQGSQIKTPNIILVCIESFSADFLTEFGNDQNLTPNYENLAKSGIFFTNMFATGTRTVRGMEALTLCVPPTPGNSIVRRPENDGLFSVATILKKNNYNLDFIYGGDGYFDNMNTFFGGQGFTIVDRNRGNPLSEDIHAKRISIEDQDVTFENAWGICDEDIYRQALKTADAETKTGKPFFQFIMTTSNHKPYTFPENRISAPQGSRESAVKYTDFALGKFIAES